MHMPVLAYHLVTDKVDLGFARTSMKQFQRQMAWLQENEYQTLTLQEAANFNYAKSQNSSQKYVVLTFDDAYASIQHAAEIMSDYGFVGTCFAISDYIGKLNNWDYQFYARKWLHADAHLLKSLVQAGWEVGSHSRRHHFLGRLSKIKLSEDLAVSRDRISELTGKLVKTISYPFGYADQRVCKIARHCGYQYGVGLGLPFQKQIKLGKMCMPRLGVYLFDTLYSFQSKIQAFNKTSTWHFALQQIISFGSRATVLLKS